MTIQSIQNPSAAPIIVQKTKPKDSVSSGSGAAFSDTGAGASKKTKIGVFATTLLGVAAGMAVMMKMKKLPLKNPKDFFKNLVSISYDSKTHEVEKLVGIVAAGSVGGGLIGGAIFDKKENMKAKLREAIIQLIGNIGTPLLCVSAGIHLFENKAEKKLVEVLKLTGKTAKVPKIVASAGLLVAAIFAGNKIGNVLNEKLFNVKDNRKLKLSDMSPHIDDACLALSLVAADSSRVISRFIPAALTIAGYSTGTAQERPERLKAKAQTQQQTPQEPKKPENTTVAS